MAAPEYVPTRPTDDPRSYKSPPRRPESWRADRPAEVVDGGQPHGHLLGSPGPDQGYALKLVRLFEERLSLDVGEPYDDAEMGCVLVALKRAAMFGRAPVVHDLTIAFTVWGFLDASAPAELIALRRKMFEEVRNNHHYAEQRAIVDAVPESTLRLSPEVVTERHRADWKSLLSL